MRINAADLKGLHENRVIFSFFTEPIVNKGVKCPNNMTSLTIGRLQAPENMDEKKTHSQTEVDLERKRRGEKLGRQLRRLYDDVTQEHVPDEFLRLLEEADKARSTDDTNKAS